MTLNHLIASIGLVSLLGVPMLGQNQQSQQKPPAPTEDRAPRVIFLNGIVVMDDDSPLEDRLSVELICNSSVLRQTKVNRKGIFSFELGDRNASNLSLADATVSGSQSGLFGGSSSSGVPGDSRSTAGGFRRAGLGRVDLSTCQVRLQPNAGFTSNSIRLDRRSVFDDPDIGAIVVHRISEEEGSTISLVALSAPKNAKRSYARAEKELGREQPRLEEVEKHLAKAVQIFPEFSAAHDLMGQIKLRQGDREAAKEAFRQAIKAEPRFVNPYFELTRLELQDENYAAAEPLVDGLKELKVQDLAGLYFHGLVKYNLEKFQDAQESFSTLSEKGGAERFPQSLWLLGLIHWDQQKIPEAAEAFRGFLVSGKGRIPSDITNDVEKQLLEWENKGLIEKVQEP